MLDEPEYSQNQLLLISIGLPVIILFFYFTAVLHFSFTDNETYVYLQYARNLASGDGYSFNAGEQLNGTVGPLWVLLIAVGKLFNLPFLLTAKILDLVFASASIIVFFFLAYEILRHRIYALAGTLLFSMNANLIFRTGNGLEISLGLLFFLVALRYCYRNEYQLSSLATAIGTLVIPLIGLFLFLIVYDLLLNSKDRSRGWRIIRQMLLIYCCVVVPWMVYSALFLHSVIPTPYIAASIFHGGFLMFLISMLHFCKNVFLSEVLMIVAFFCAIFILYSKKRNNADQRKSDWLILHLPVLWIILFSIFQCVFGFENGSRFILLIDPCVLLISLWSIRRIQQQFPVSASGFITGDSILLIFLGMGLLYSQLTYHVTTQRHMKDFAQNADAVYRPIAEWLQKNSPNDAIIATNEPGPIAFYSQRKVCDITGVRSPELLNMKKIKDDKLDDMLISKIIDQCHPDYIVDRAFVAERLSDVNLVPLFHKMFYGYSSYDRRVVYFTVYKVQHNIQPKAQRKIMKEESLCMKK